MDPMTMKAQTKRWVFAVGIAGSLLAILFYLDRSAPAAQFTQLVPMGHPLVVPSTPAPSISVAPAARIAADPVRESYIVQAASAGEAASAVVRAGGQVTGDLSVIRAVSVLLDAGELQALQAANVPGLNVFPDTKVTASSALGALPETYYPSEVAAQQLQLGGLTGTGVTVAVVDSGLWNNQGPLQYSPDRTRVACSPSTT